MKAFASVAAKHPNAVLRIAGDGIERPLVEEAIREAGLSDRVQLLGFIPNARAMQELVLVQSVCAGGVGRTVRHRVPGSRVGGQADGVVQRRRDQRRVADRRARLRGSAEGVGEAAAAIDRLLTDPASRTRMGAAGTKICSARN